MRASLVLIVALGLVATALAGSRSLLHSGGNDSKVNLSEKDLAEIMDILQRIEEEEPEGAGDQGSRGTRSVPYVSVQQHNRLVRWLGKHTKQLDSYNKEQIPQLNLKPAEKN